MGMWLPDSLKADYAATGLGAAVCVWRAFGPELDGVTFEETKIFSAKVGGFGMVGVPAAIANAVFHATGKRISDLPITPDKLL